MYGCILRCKDAFCISSTVLFRRAIVVYVFFLPGAYIYIYIFVKIFLSTAPTSRKQRAWMVFETLEYGDYVTIEAVAILDPEPKQNLNSNFNNKNNQIFKKQRFRNNFCNSFDDCFL